MNETRDLVPGGLHRSFSRRQAGSASLSPRGTDDWGVADGVGRGSRRGGDRVGYGGSRGGAYDRAVRGGKRVLVLEQHYTPGGMTHEFSHAGRYRFGTGLHYMSASAGPFLGFMTDGRAQLSPLPDEYDALHFPGFDFAVPATEERFRARLKERFPAEADAIDAFFRTTRRAIEFTSGPGCRPVAHGVVVPHAAGQEVLQPGRRRVLQRLGERQAVAGLKPRQYRLGHVPGQQPRLPSRETAGHRGHSRPQTLAPHSTGYRGAYGHRVLICCHRRSSSQWPYSFPRAPHQAAHQHESVRKRVPRTPTWSAMPGARSATGGGS
ncbi:NAD(P)-binding protein [Streptomyces sp. NPDC005811]|uniref:NAD(P)-binding protein n=1 Tax=Streptomyces sp. NPDC005811 TaxID=3154565 RepID=UPI0033C5C70D